MSRSRRWQNGKVAHRCGRTNQITAQTQRGARTAAAPNGIHVKRPCGGNCEVQLVRPRSSRAMQNHRPPWWTGRVVTLHPPRYHRNLHLFICSAAAWTHCITGKSCYHISGHIIDSYGNWTDNPVAVSQRCCLATGCVGIINRRLSSLVFSFYCNIKAIFLKCSKARLQFSSCNSLKMFSCEISDKYL